MAGNNRVFPCIHSNIVSPEQKCSAVLCSCSHPQALLDMLLFYRSFHHRSVIGTNDTFPCSALCGNTATSDAFICPHASPCEDSNLHDCLAFQAFSPPYYWSYSLQALSFQTIYFYVCVFSHWVHKLLYISYARLVFVVM